MGMTPAKLRQMAAKARAQAADLIAHAEVYEHAAVELERLTALPTGKQKNTVDGDMVDSHRLAISKARGGTRRDGFTLAMRAAKHSLHSLGRAVGVSAGHLSLVSRGLKGASDDLKARIEKEIGYRLP